MPIKRDTKPQKVILLLCKGHEKRLVFRRKSSRKSAPQSRDLTYCWAQSAFFLYNILKYLGSQNEPIIIVHKCREEPLRKKERKNYQKAAIIQQLQSSTIHHTSSIVIENF